MRTRSLPSLLLALVPALTPVTSQASEQYQSRRIASVRASATPTIDGDISDPVWATAARADTFIDRNRGLPAADQTTCLLLYDNTYIYVAFDCKDTQPDAIVARETVRDSLYTGAGETDDRVDVRFDPFRSHRTSDSASFSVNAIGTPSASLAGGRAGKLEWKGDWIAAARKTHDGWTAEMRIPWAIINYPVGAEKIDVGLNMTRYQNRTQIDSVWSDTGPERFLERQGTWLNVDVPRTAFRPSLSLLPYLLPTLERSDASLKSGMDARYTLTPELTAVGTVNPDFGTIEGAIEGIQFSRSERWIEERRPFFLDGGDTISTGGNYGSLFYANRIRSFDAGAKLYGKLTPTTTMGLLSTMDFGHRYDTVMHLRRDFSATGGMGFFLMNKTADGDDNSVVAASGHQRFGKVTVEGQAGLSGGKDAGGGMGTLDLYYQDKNHFTDLSWTHVDARFRVADGYVPYKDWHGLSLYHEWTTPWRHGRLRQFHMEAQGLYLWHLSGAPFRRQVFLEAAIETRDDWRIRVAGQHNWFDASTDSSLSATITRGITNRFRRIGISVEDGKVDQSRMTFIGPFASVRTLDKLDISYSGSLLNLQGQSQQHIATFTYEFSPVRSLGGRVVVWDGDTNWYVSYRHSGAKGTETYLIVGDPNARTFEEQLSMKLVFAI